MPNVLPAPAAELPLLGVEDSDEDYAALRWALRRVGVDRAVRIPVVVWTTSAHPDDVAHCYAHGASGYATKPVDVGQLVVALRNVTQYWFGCVILPDAPPVAPSRRDFGAHGPA